MEIYRIATKLGKPELNGTKLTVYHRTKTEDIAGSICEIGFKAGGGAAYGVGIYTTYSYESSLQNYNLGTYGAEVVKGEMDINGFLILDYAIAKQVYGSNYKLIDQVKNVIGEDKILGFGDKDRIRESLQKYSEGLEDTEWTSDTASAIANRWGLDKTGLKGIIYTGRNDGNVALAYKQIGVIPIAHAFIDGKTFKNPNWEPCPKRTAEELRKLQDDEVKVRAYENERFQLLSALENFSNGGQVTLLRNRFPNIPDAIFNQVIASYLYEDRIKINQLDETTKAELKDIIEVDFVIRKLRSSPTVNWKEYDELDESIKAKIPKDVIAEIWENYMKKNPGHWTQIPESARNMIPKNIEAKYWKRVVRKNEINWKYVPKDIAEYMFDNMKVKKPDNFDTLPTASLTSPIEGAEEVGEGDKVRETEEFEVMSASMGWIQEEIRKLNIRATRLGLLPIVMEVLSENRAEKTQQIKIIGNVPVLSGWKLFAKIDIVKEKEIGEDGEEKVVGENRIIQPLSEEIIPEELNLDERELTCEHCNQNRARNEYYVVKNSNDGSFKIIGSGCIADFVGDVGGKNPQGIAEYAQELRQIIAKFREGDKYANKSDRQIVIDFKKNGVPTSFFLGKVIELMKAGNVPKADYYTRKEDPNAQPTQREIEWWGSDIGRQAWQMCVNPIDDQSQSKGLSATDVTTIMNAMDWIKKTKDVEPPTGEYNILYSLKKQIDSGTVFKRRKKYDTNASTVATLVPMYKRFVTEEKKFDKLLGEIGSEINFKGKVKFHKPVWTSIRQQSVQNLTNDYYVAESDSGEKVAWYGVKIPFGIGDEVVLKGKVEGYTNVDGISATSLKEITIISDKEYQDEKSQKDAELNIFREANKDKSTERKDDYKEQIYYKDGDSVEGQFKVKRKISRMGNAFYELMLGEKRFTSSERIADWASIPTDKEHTEELRGTVKISIINGRKFTNIVNIQLLKNGQPIQPLNTHAPAAPAPAARPAVTPYQHGDRVEDNFVISYQSPGNYYGKTRYALKDSFGRDVSTFTAEHLGMKGETVRLKGIIGLKPPYVNLLNPEVVRVQPPANVPVQQVTQQVPPVNNPPTIVTPVAPQNNIQTPVPQPDVTSNNNDFVKTGNWYFDFKIITAMESFDKMQIEASTLGTDMDLDKAYNIFEESYKKTVGTAWDKNKFVDRARDWIFYGDETGYVTVRPQRSGLLKLTGIAGNFKSALRGLNELLEEGKPVWGMVSAELANMAERVGFTVMRGMKTAIIMKILMPSIPSGVFGNTPFKVNMDGSITFDYPDVGTANKFFIANKEYFDWLKAQPSLAGKIPDFVKNMIVPTPKSKALKKLEAPKGTQNPQELPIDTPQKTKEIPEI